MSGRVRLALALASTVSACTGSAGIGDTDPADASTGAADETTGDTGDTGDTGAEPNAWDDLQLWLCHPDQSQQNDACRSNDLSTTVLRADGSMTVVPHETAENPAFDCFYVYPTVDIRLEPGQTEDFVDLAQELDPLLNQAARFTSMCRVFAPLYHQVTIGTFGSAEQDALLDAAYADVREAFRHYLEHQRDGRDFVIMGHSQGERMTRRLVADVVEDDAALRSDFIAGLLIGGGVSVPPGERVGGTFDSVPLCASETETGCIVAFRSYARDLPPEPGNQSASAPGLDLACTNPAAGTAGPRPLSDAIVPVATNQPLVFPTPDIGVPVTTPFVSYPEFFSAECLVDSDGLSFLAIATTDAPGDVRTNPIDFNHPLLNPGFLGLHVWDYNLPLGDLLRIVEAKAAAMD